MPPIAPPPPTLLAAGADLDGGGMPERFVVDLLIILAAGLVASVVCRRLWLSSIVGYLAIGALLGAGGVGAVTGDREEVVLLAEVGVFLLLFTVGLEFSIGDLRSLAWRLPVGGGVQMSLVAVPVALAGRSMGLSWPAAGMLAAATSFSSTVLVFKTLSELGQASTPHGRRAIGILLFQDIALVPLLLLAPLLTEQTPRGAAELLLLAVKAGAFVVAVVLFRLALTRTIVPRLAAYRSPDLVVLLTIVVLGLATLGAAVAELPAAIGALAAGLCFGGNRWSAQVDALVLPFREAFAVVFFVGLGLIIDLRVLLTDPLPILSLTAAVVGVKAAAGAVAVWLTGLSARASLGVGLGLAHVGEFAFVLAMTANQVGLVSDAVYSQFATAAFLTLLLTPPQLKAGLKLTGAGEEAAPAAGERPTPGRLEHALVIGAGLAGKQIASYLETGGVEVALVDRSPVNLYPFSQAGMRTLSGDATDPALLAEAGCQSAGLIVVCISSDDAAERIVREARRLNPSGRLIVRCRFEGRVRKLAALGADIVVSEEREACARLLGLLDP